MRLRGEGGGAREMMGVSKAHASYERGIEDPASQPASQQVSDQTNCGFMIFPR